MSFANQDIHNAAGPVSSSEPSMEEILASIRRILKEDEPGKPVVAPGVAPGVAAMPEMPEVDVDDDILLLDESMVARPVDVLSATMVPAEAFPVAEQSGAPLQSRVEPLHFSSEPTPFGRDFEPAGRVLPEPVVELPPTIEAESVPLPLPLSVPHRDEYGGMVDAGVDDSHGDPVFAPHSEPVAFQTGAEAFDDNTPKRIALEPVEEVSAEYHATPKPGPEFVWSRTPEPAHATANTQPDLNETVPYSRESIQTEPEMNDSTSPDGFAPPHSLISDQTTDAAASSIGALVRSMTAEKSVAISRSSSITIEDIVREEIRPMLKSWLDANLPSLVERIVRSEIERVINRSVL